MGGFLAGLIYLAYHSFVPQGRKPKSRKTPISDVSAPVGTVTATGARYQEEWIPERHLQKPKTSKKKIFSGGETSGTEEKTKKAEK